VAATVAGPAVPGVRWPRVGATAAEVVHREGTARLLRYRADPAAARRLGAAPPLLMVLPVINRFYILDLTPATSWVAAMQALGVETFLLDWGRPTLADRGVGLERLTGILARCEARVLDATNERSFTLAGYCLGGTIAATRAALAAAAGDDAACAGLVTLNAPVSFADAGMLGFMTEPANFPLDALLDAFGNMPGGCVQSGFTNQKPMQMLSKWKRVADIAADEDALEEFAALELWNADNVPLPGAFYRTLIEDLYRGDRLAKGTLEVGGRRVDLGAIRVPVLAIATEDDAICLPGQASALLGLVASARKDALSLRGGHVKAVLGKKARERLCAPLAAWIRGLGEAARAS
jgi:polyhydroxyalkanoate synthase